jgi:hypothetical protein
MDPFWGILNFGDQAFWGFPKQKICAILLSTAQPSSGASHKEADMERSTKAAPAWPGAENMESLVARLTPAQQQEFYRVTAALAIACAEAIRQVLEAMAGPAPAADG